LIGGGARGAMMSFTRQPTARRMLDIDWVFPKALELSEATGSTVASARMVALSRDEALRQLRVDDSRPLLVLRECGACKDTENALLDLKLDNEKTKLLTRWFHCIKLRPNVVEPHHTFHALFSGEKPPHLFLCMPDGSQLVPLDGQQSQTLLWKHMDAILRRAYEGDPDDAVRGLFKLMSEYDALDARESELREQLEAEVEKDGASSAKVARLQAQLDLLGKQRDRLKAREREISDLGLRAAD
jgi:hypothetical protein